MLNFKSVLAAVAAAGIEIAASAGAQTTGADVPKLVLHYSPASLSTDSGVRQLYGRLVTAAEKVCEAPQVGRFVSDAELACRRHAVAEAVAQINNSRLADLSARYTKTGSHS
jgi:UrcA family protein